MRGLDFALIYYNLSSGAAASSLRNEMLFFSSWSPNPKIGVFFSKSPRFTEESVMLMVPEKIIICLAALLVAKHEMRQGGERFGGEYEPKLIQV